MKRRIFLAAVGTHGDILPALALAAGLQARGHAVQVAAPEPFRSLANHAGLAFHPLGTAAEFARAVGQAELWRPVRGAKAMLASVAAAIAPTYDWLEAEAGPDDLVVASTLALGARLAQEHRGLSLATLHLMPMLLESRFAPPRLPGLPLPRILPAALRHELGRGADRFVLGPAALPSLNAVRARLGLDPVRRLRHWWHSPERVLLAVPDWYAPPQPDWPAQIVQVGFPLADTFGEAAELAPDLAAFLRAGPAPVAFTYGSAMAGAQGFFAAAVEASRLSGRRAILLAGRAEEIPASLPPGVIHVAYAPLSRLLPDCAAQVHHGGVGTVAQALAAGCPQLIVPVAFDHADEAKRVERLGAGKSLARWRFTPTRARRAIEELVGSPAVAEACREVRVLMRAENGVAQACEALLRPPSAMPLPGRAAGPSRTSGAAVPSGQTVCLCLVVRDQAPLLRACLDSVRPLIDSWVVVDAGSTDGTQDVVRRALAGLPGALHERPGGGFAETRSEALHLARQHGTHCLLIEAEERLDVPAGTRLPVLTADSYTLDVASGDTVSRRKRILRTALPWRYDGVIPETLACDTAGPAGHLPGPTLRRVEALRRDPEADRLATAAIETALAGAPTPLLAAHYTFHLAQQLRDRREVEAAIARFLERADQGFSPEEVYVSLLEAGRLMQRAGRPLAAVLAPLDRAMALIPTRAEAPHAASGACRMHADYTRATRYAITAAATPRPEHGLFLEPWIYAYGALDELAVNAYWAGDDRTSLEATLRALASGAVPDDQRARFLANTRFPPGPAHGRSNPRAVTPALTPPAPPPGTP